MRRRSPDGSEFRNKFPYFPESTIENKCSVHLTLFVRSDKFVLEYSLIVKSIVLLGFFFTF
jgi:hypothetical protein